MIAEALWTGPFGSIVGASACERLRLMLRSSPMDAALTRSEEPP
jgi:hypothetical protein